MPDKRQNPAPAPGSDASESPRLAIRRHTDRCFHVVEEVVYDGPPVENAGGQFEGRAGGLTWGLTGGTSGGRAVLGYIIDGVMIDADDVAQVRHIPNGEDSPTCNDT